MFESYTINEQFRDWALGAINEMNDAESEDRKTVEDVRFDKLQKAKARSGRLIDMIAEGIIGREDYEERHRVTEQEIKTLEAEISNANKVSADWREGMRRVVETLFDGKSKFDNGDIFTKREVLQSLGSNIVFLDGKLQLDTYEWLIPVKESCKKLQEDFEKVRTGPQQRQKDTTQGIMSSWLGIVDVFRNKLYTINSL